MVPYPARRQPHRWLILLALVAALLVAAAGELVAERGGVVNIGIEGMMLAGALAAWVANGFGGPWWGLIAAVLAAGGLAFIFAMATLRFAADQIVTGTGINLLALGATALASKRLSQTMAEKTVTGINPLWMTAVYAVTAGSSTRRPSIFSTMVR